MTREPDKFQIQLAETIQHWASIGGINCSRCGQAIKAEEDPEHVIIWPRRSDWAIANDAVGSNPLRFHPDPCFDEVLSGLMEFYKVFIIEKRKKQRKAN